MCKPVKVDADHVTYGTSTIDSRYEYHSTHVDYDNNGTVHVRPKKRVYRFHSERKVRRTGLMMVGWGGNNGTTVTTGLLAKKEGMRWETEREMKVADLKGSIVEKGTLRLGVDKDGREVFVPVKSLVPMAEAGDLVVGGWDISGMNMAEAMDRAGVVDVDLRKQLRSHMKMMVPLAGVYDEQFIAKNQRSRADNCIESKKKHVQLSKLRDDIKEFKARHELDFCVVMWTANSERYSRVIPGINDTAENLLTAIENSHEEISPSTLYAVAAIQTGCPYVNGSPQNTFVPGCYELAVSKNIPIAGDDFKSGQTKMKSVLADYLISCGIKIKTMVTYNHLGNNDMYQLTDEVMWKPKSASKSRVIEDIVGSNGLLYKENEKPDHVVVVKYVPFLGDSKRDVSEYTSETFLNAHYTTVMHNTCLDSALCAPLIIDLTIFMELFSRVTYAIEDEDGRVTTDFRPMYPVMSVLGFYMKIPQIPPNESIVNALSRQRACIDNLLRALVGLQPDSNLMLETKCIPSDLKKTKR